MDNKIKIFSARGRLTRLRYSSYVFIMNLIMTVLTILADLPFFSAMINQQAHPTMMHPTLTIILQGINLIVMIFGLVMMILWGIRRLNDRDMKGWWMFLMLIPLLNLIFALFLLFARGTEGDNHYGPETTNSKAVKFWGIWAPIIVILLSLIYFSSMIHIVASAASAAHHTTH